MTILSRLSKWCPFGGAHGHGKEALPMGEGAHGDLLSMETDTFGRLRKEGLNPPPDLFLSRRVAICVHLSFTQRVREGIRRPEPPTRPNLPTLCEARPDLTKEPKRKSA